jgi:hypothetical protein
MLVATGTPQTAKEYGSITGSVSLGQTGITRVFVYVRDGLKGGKSDRTLETDSNGNFSIPSLPPGLYDVFFSDVSFLPVCQRVEVVAGKNNALTIKLEVDRAHMENSR